MQINKMVRAFLGFAFFILAFNVESKKEQVLDGVFDKNQDGIADVFYKYLKNGSYNELSDTNYDGEVDVICAYDSNDTLEHCSYDQNFDGYSETTTEYLTGMPMREGVDINKNQTYEVIFLYKSGVLTEGFKYYSNDNGGKMIGHVRFEFGYPLDETFTKTKLSELEFSKKYWSKKVVNLN